MNSLESKAKNYLYTSDKDEDSIIDFFQIAASLVKNNKVVLLITREHVDFLPILSGLSKEQMQNLLVSYISDVNNVVDKFLELHDWTILPDLVILNLNSFYEGEESVPTFKKICFCVSTLFHYMKSLEKQMLAGKKEDACKEPTSITLLNSHPAVRIQMLIDFYFYKSTKFSQLDVIKQEIFNRF